MNYFHLGSESEFVKMTMPASYVAEGWAQANVEISVNCFSGTIRAYVELDDFVRFFKELKVLYESLQGRAEFSPMDKQIVIAVTGNGRGQMLVTGEAWEHATYGNRLVFELALDQTFLVGPLAQLEGLFGRASDAAV
jgi:hypothetical protein